MGFCAYDSSKARWSTSPSVRVATIGAQPQVSQRVNSADADTFLELEVSLKNGSSLQQRLEAMLVPELLDGANKYRCPQCNDLRPATRQTKPSSLPRFIHFSLLRFEYDQKSGSRKKVKASISYPKKLQLGGQEYELCGVITHEGSHVSEPPSGRADGRHTTVTSSARSGTNSESR